MRSRNRRLPFSPLLEEAAKGTAGEALALMHTSLAGLSLEEVEKRRALYGSNEVARERPPAWWVQLAGAFYNPFIIILLVLAAVSLVTDVILPGRMGANWSKVVILGVMITVSGVLRFWQEFRSAMAAQKLKALVHTTAAVSRQGQEMEGAGAELENGEMGREIPMVELVPGDIVHLSAGDMVPADVRLLVSKDLFVSQSALTGEAMPVEKGEPHQVVALADAAGEIHPGERGRPENPSANLLEAGTLCFMGTSVVNGSASAVVVATGVHTFFGSLARTVLGSRPLTSFDIGVNKVSALLIRFMLVMVPVVMVINGVTKGDWKEALLFGLAVAVGLTPEMLPLVVTANLARGAVKMSTRKVVVKRLNSIQNFGAMDVLCTDKTGTLTEDRVALVQYLDADGRSSIDVLVHAFLNSYFQTGLKNLLDHAVIGKAAERAVEKIGRDYEKVDEIPFDFTRRRMSVVLRHRVDQQLLLICKGAVDEVLGGCVSIREGGLDLPLPEERRDALSAFRDTLNADGLRVLAVACKEIGDGRRAFAVADETGMVFLGFIAFLDPPKPSASKAIASLATHGVAVKVITGDNAVIAAKVCREVGLDPGEVVKGSEIDDLSDTELGELAARTLLFVRMSPSHKARIIRCLKLAGHSVGYMGDGINDSAALREADVGISVDTAVDIARESADIILLEKSLMVLEQGIIEGRSVFGNIIKYIKMTTSSNFGNVFSILVASAFLPFLPMLPLQLLIQNLLYDLSQLSLPWDRMDADFLEQPRKWEPRGLARFMFFVGPTSSIFDMVTFGVLWSVFGANTLAVQSLFQSGWFVEGLLSQTLIVHMIRTRKIPFIQSWAAPPVILLTLAIMTLGIAIPFTRFGASIGLQPLPVSYFPWLVGILFSYCVLVQWVKGWYIRLFGGWL